MTTNVPLPAARAAPPLLVTQWFNTERPITLEALRGRVVVLHAFQMLCPGCVSHGLPQAQRIQDTFGAADVSVIGLHTVFEHHEAMTPVSLAAFLHEYRIPFPVGVDKASADGTPETMKAYGMRGTPSLVLIGRSGSIEQHHFGRPSDLRIGAAIAELIASPASRELTAEQDCDENACQLPSQAGAA